MVSPSPQTRLEPEAEYSFAETVWVVVRGSGWSLAWMLAGIAAGYALHVLMAQWLGAVDYGTYMYVLGWVALLSVPAGLGLSLASVRFVPEYHALQQWGALRGLLKWGSKYIALVGTVLAASACAVVLLLGNESIGVYTLPLLVGVWLVPLQALLAFEQGVFVGLYRVGWSRALTTLRHSSVAVLAGVVVISGYRLSPTGALLVTLLAVLVVLVTQGLALWWKMPREVRATSAVMESRTWRRVGFPLLMVAGFIAVIDQTDVLMVGSLLGPLDAGLYRAASRTAALAGMVPVAVGAAADPMLVRLHAGERKEDVQSLASFVALCGFGAALLVAAGFVVMGPFLLRLFGAEFIGAYDVLLVLTAGQASFAGAGIAGGLLNLTGHQRVGMLIYGAGALLNVALNALGIALFGRLGAAAASSITLLVLGVVLWFAARRYLSIDASVLYALARKRLR